MGRLILLVLIIAAIYLVYKAFGPHTWNRNVDQRQQPPAIKGPDDDENFLWELDKQRFKERRAREREAENQRKQHPNQESGQDSGPEPGSEPGSGADTEDDNPHQS
ncbi:hypothetical protein [Corynebacterium lizhenjunii]|uniref:hypothetical protein n=1 Tax=Corynebacterium lizhenjunii TaxID=2709394 RepID=UPI001FD18069|nr:hypothetical protein [Corynebacterium lizhenjunii]